LRKALWQLQSFLHLYNVQNMLLIDGEWLQINPNFELWLDVDVFEQAIKETNGSRGRELDGRQAQIIQHTVDIYRGDLLEGWYQDWCLFERERLQHYYLAMIDKLMAYCEIHQQYETGHMYGDKILRYDRAREHTHRRLMRLYYLAGDRTAALRQYKKCVQALMEELGVEPSEDTRRLNALIQADKLDRTAITEPVGADSTNLEEEPLSVVFQHFITFHKALAELQTKLDQDMITIQKAIKGSQD
jgi:DNA-binding SARP family transcriptional activator